MKRLFNRPWLLIAAIAVVTVFFALQLPKAVLDNNTFRFVPEDDPARLSVERIDEQYGNQISILVGFKRSYGTVLEKDFLLTLKDFCDKAVQLKRANSVMSLMNVDYITGDASTIKVDKLVGADFSGTDAEIAALRERLRDWDMFDRTIISDDQRSTQVLVTLDGSSSEAGSSDTVKLYDELLALAKASGFKDTEIFVAGMPAFSAAINAAMRSDLTVLIPLVVLVVLMTLYLSFRRIGGIVLPMITVLVSSIWALGAMALLGVKLSLLATVLPVILVAVGSAYGIHVVSHYYDALGSRKRVSKEIQRDIVLHVLKRVGRPVLLAALTTLAGFASLAITPVKPIQEFGIFATFGVLVAFLISIFLIPALLLVRGPGKGKFVKDSEADVAGAEDSESDVHLESDHLARLLADGFGAIASHRGWVMAITALVVIVGLVGSSKLVIDNIIVNYFKPGAGIAQSDVFIREEFAGSKTLSLIIKGQEKGSINHPDILGAMDDLATYLEAEVPEVGKVMGYHQLIKRANQIFNAAEPADKVRGSVASASTGDDSAWSAFDDASGDTGDFGFDGDEVATDSPAPSTAAIVSDGSVEADPALDKAALVALLSRTMANAGKQASPNELIRRLEQEINFQGAAYYEIPRNPARYNKTSKEELQGIIANYLVLLGGDTKSWINDPLEPSETRMNIQLRTVGQSDTNKAVKAIEDFVAKRFPAGYTVEVSGVAIVEKALNELVVSSQLISIITSLFMVFLILLVYYRSFAAGLIGVFNLALSILINFAIMGFTGVRLNIGTAMVSSIAIGTGIDYIIHYLAAYHHETLASPGSPRILRRTFLTSGKAIIFNAVAVAAGFAVLVFSQFNLLLYLGILISISMGVSSLVSLTVLPVLLDWLKPKFILRPLYWDTRRNVQKGSA